MPISLDEREREVRNADRRIGVFLAQGRRERRETQREFAYVASLAGLPWTGEIVADLERGTRSLTLFEATVLFGGDFADVLPVALPQETTLPPSESADAVDAKVSRALGWSLRKVRNTAKKLWGHGVAEEREARLDFDNNGWPNIFTLASRRSLRRRALRALCTELRRAKDGRGR